MAIPVPLSSAEGGQMKPCPSGSSKEIVVSLIKGTLRLAVAHLYCTSSLLDSGLQMRAIGGLTYGIVLSLFYTNMKTQHEGVRPP